MKNVIWEAFEIAVNFFQGFIMIYFVHAYLGNKHTKSFLKSSGVVYAAALAVLITILNSIMVFEHFLALLYAILIMVYAVIHLNGSIQRKIFASVYSVMIILIPSALVTNIMAIIFGSNLYDIFSINDTNRLVTILIGHLVILYFLMLSFRIFIKNNDERELTKTEWMLISLVLLLSIAIGGILNIVSMKLAPNGGQIYLVFAIAGLILINIVVCYLISSLGKKNKALRENEILKLQQEYNRQYIKNAAVEYDVLRKLRHDFKDNYSVIYSLFSENKIDKGLEFINSCIGMLSETEVFINTDNDIVNAVINTKLSAAKSLGIECTCLSVKNFKGIEDSDLCRLLSNMLENAISACISSKSENKYINLKITFDEYNYIFNLKNTIDTSVLEENPALKTTKSDSKSHGFGTKIIRDIAEKYNGQCDYYEEKNFFCCNVILPSK